MKSTLIIKNNSIFRYVLKKGRYSKGKNIVIHVCNIKNEKNKLDDINYLGICVSKKNGNSVARNKLKRWVREIYKNEELSLKKGFNIVILFKKNCLFKDVTYLSLDDDIKKCFEELQLHVLM